jgi:dephospho-CoA kinase
MLRIALTGGIATGKSHVRAELERHGIPTIDSDLLARRAVEPGAPALAAIVERFGSEVLDRAGRLDRRALGAVVFADEDARRDLEAIVHPAVRAALDDWFASLDPSDHAVAVAVIPLLYETRGADEFDAVITTACDPTVQLRRVMERDGLSRVEAQQRLDAQLPTEERVRRADYVITTDGSYEDTNRQVREVVAELGGGSG